MEIITLVPGEKTTYSSSIMLNALKTFVLPYRDFVFWNIPQIQFKNPNVQVVTLKNMTPSPFVRCYFEDGRDMLIDIDSRDKDQIIEHLVKVVGKTR